MDSVRVALVDAFTDEPLAGNVAGVVPDATGLSTPQMAAIAREINASETAFLLPSGEADRRVRYFTPTTEVDLCGHATIAAHGYAQERGDLPAGTHTLETAVGVLEVDIAEDGTVWMTQDQPSIRRLDRDRAELAETLGMAAAPLEEMADELPVAVASTGLAFLLVPAAYLDDVGSADPDMDAVEALCEEVDATGVYLYTFDTLDRDSTLHGRMFAPLAGVPEDPVTGTASGAVGAFLRHVGAFDGDLPDPMVLEQGHYVDRPGRVLVRCGEDVRVGGDSVVSMEGDLAVPEVDEDEILEA